MPKKYSNLADIDYKNLSKSKFFKILKELQEIYTHTKKEEDDEEILSDEEFNFLVDYYEYKFKDEFVEVGSTPTKGAVDLPFFMPSLKKIKGITAEKDLNNWIKSFPSSSGDTKEKEDEYVIMDKLDGVSLLYLSVPKKQTLFTRGNGVKGEDKSYLSKNLDLPVEDYEIVVRGEFVIHNSTFKKYKEKFEEKNPDTKNKLKKPRNLVAGLINAVDNYDVKLLKKCKFYAYELISYKGKTDLTPLKQLTTLKKLGFNIPWYMVINEETLNIKFLTKKLCERKGIENKYEEDFIEKSLLKTEEENSEGESNKKLVKKDSDRKIKNSKVIQDSDRKNTGVDEDSNKKIKNNRVTEDSDRKIKNNRVTEDSDRKNSDRKDSDRKDSDRKIKNRGVIDKVTIKKGGENEDNSDSDRKLVKKGENVEEEEKEEIAPYDIDGIVIKKNIPNTLAENADRPKNAISFKVDQTFSATVKKIIFKASSKDGYLTPTVYIKKVNILGSDVRKTSGYNARFIYDNKIGIGSKVLIGLAGEVIPKIFEVLIPSSEENMVYPDLNKSEYEWNKNKVEFVLTNPESNIDVQKSRLEFFIKTLGIKSIGEKVIDNLFEAGFNTLEKILDMTPEDILDAKVERMAIKSATKACKNIHDAITGCDLATIMHASCCFGEGFGKRMSKKILNVYCSSGKKKKSSSDSEQSDSEESDSEESDSGDKKNRKKQKSKKSSDSEESDSEESDIGNKKNKKKQKSKKRSDSEESDSEKSDSEESDSGDKKNMKKQKSKKSSDSEQSNNGNKKNKKKQKSKKSSDSEESDSSEKKNYKSKKSKKKSDSDSDEESSTKSSKNVNCMEALKNLYKKSKKDEEAVISEIDDIHGFSDIRARQFVKGLAKFIKWIKKYEEITIKENIDTSKIKGPLVGKIIAFTGIRSKNNMKKQLESMGVEISDNVTQKIDILVIKDEGSRSTVNATRAEKYGKEIITWDKFIKKYKLPED